MLAFPLIVVQAAKEGTVNAKSIISTNTKLIIVFIFILFPFRFCLHTKFGYPTFNIPNWDIFIIPFWYNIVKRGFENGEKMRLKELRKQKGISQLKLAMDLNMNQNSISRYENEEREADYVMLIKIADYFNVSIDYLLERTDNPEMNR